MEQPRKFLLIDGNFFAHRTLHGMRVVNKNITLDTDEEMRNFNNALIISFNSIFENFCNENYRVIDQIIMVFDHNSWRKGIEQFKPYYIDLLEKSLGKKMTYGYKENRNEMKEESDINYENFDFCVDQFREYIAKLDTIPLFWIKGAEGDDNLILLKERLLQENPDNKMIIFCTDGDLKQLLHIDENSKEDSVILFRNIVSKIAPNGEFVLSRPFFLNCTKEQSVFDAFLTKQDNYFNLCKDTLFKINLKDKSNRANLERQYHADIVVGTPYLTLLVKIFVGDKKDNVLPILRWANSKNTGFFSVTETALIKAFDECLMTFNEESAIKIFNDRTSLTNLIYTLIDNTKQKWLLEDKHKHLINEIGKHFSHNRKILTITHSEYIPSNVVSSFNLEFEKQRHKFDIRLTKQLLGNVMKQDFVDSKGIIATSLPSINVDDLPSELKGI